MVINLWNLLYELRSSLYDVISCFIIIYIFCILCVDIYDHIIICPLRKNFAFVKRRFENNKKRFCLKLLESNTWFGRSLNWLFVDI